MDAMDILGLSKNSMPQEKKPRLPRESQRKPDGISREVYALTGGVVPPLMPSIEPSHLKRRPLPDKEKVTWQWLPFTSSARTDNLQLYHWVRVVNNVPPTGDYSFAKYNKSVDVIKYTDEEYEKYLIDPMWTKAETDHLFDLCERFDLRFVVIADRFTSSRTVEELKSRYYSVSRALLLARAQTFSDVAGHPLVKHHFNISHEVERKRALAIVLSRTKQQEHRDSEVLAEAKRIMETHTVNKGAVDIGLPENVLDTDGIERPAANVDPPSPTSNGQLQVQSVVPPAIAVDNVSAPASLRMLRVYLRSNVLDQMVQAASSTAGLRTIKRVDQTLQDLGVHVKPKVPTKSVCAEHIELRKEILTLLNLQKQLQNKEAEASANRDNSFGEAPETPKRAYRGDIDHTYIPDSHGFGGERAVKRDHKRKNPGRFIDGPPSPPQLKKSKKFRISDGYI